jgi:raffinose/stachyose/melibiose transport system substrate-binding protein
MKKKLLSAILSTAMVATVLSGCGSSSDDSASSSSSSTSAPSESTSQSTTTTDNSTAATTESTATTESAGTGKVYYLNFKPEQAQDWEDLAAEYTAETGIEVSVQTAASGTYESTLKSEMAKTDAPTLFQVNGPVGLATWKDYCYDLSGSDVYAQLKSDDFALKDGNEVKGIAYVVETYGIIYNVDILDDYFTKDYAVVTSVDEINNFDTLKAVADSIQENKDDLGVQGAFTSAGMDSSSDWRFKTHLANLPIYYEYQADGIESTDAIKGTYLDNYKNVWDMYITDSTCSPTLLSSKTGDDATAEFALGEAVFYQNGTWAYGDLSSAGMDDSSLGMLPIYIGADGEENQGLCTGSENYWCVNKNASAEDIQATLDFINWCVTSEEGCTALSQTMGFVSPFKEFDNYPESNPLIQIANDYVAAGKTSVAWTFTTMPSETWKDNVGSALLEYAQGTGDWSAVETAFVDGWATEYAAANN